MKTLAVLSNALCALSILVLIFHKIGLIPFEISSLLVAPLMILALILQIESKNKEIEERDLTIEEQQKIISCLENKINN